MPENCFSCIKNFRAKLMTLLLVLQIAIASFLPTTQAVICLYGGYCLADMDCEANASCEVIKIFV
jgi:hypothetical protein